MEGICRNGVLKLPPGFRFFPTDEELVLQYLRRKVFDLPLPAQIIPESNLTKFSPWDLPGNTEGERYFFNRREAKHGNGNRSGRATSSGYWKAAGKDKNVTVSGSHHVVGLKKVLVFYRGRPNRGSRTDWIMHEYRLAEALKIESAEDWVVCRVFKKKRNNSRNSRREDESPSSSSCSSSCVTEQSSIRSCDEDEASSKRIASFSNG